MHKQWIHGFVALLCTGAVACEKDSESSKGESAETVTQSVKPTAEELAATPGSAAESAGEAKVAGEGANAVQTELKVGDPAPAVTLTLQDGKTVELSSLKGKQVAVYFYPKDDTPGCTVEAQGIRDQWGDFEKAGVQVFGVSMQDATSHVAFMEKHKLPFNLVVDDGSITKSFGVPVRDGQYAARQSFLVGADGNIKQVWREVDPAKHAAELLEAATTAAMPAMEEVDEPDTEGTEEIDPAAAEAH
jgi:peroxiredoxin Q/BCP